MKLKDIISPPPAMLKRSDNLADMIRAFRKTGYDTLPVIDEEMHLVGIINFEDISKIFEPYEGPIRMLVKAVPFLDDIIENSYSPEKLNNETICLCLAEDIMNTNFVTASDDMELSKAFSIMRIYKIGLLFIVEKGVFIGMVRIIDIIANILKERGMI